MQIYLSHKRHGKKIAMDLKESEADKKNGWSEVAEEVFFNRKPVTEQVKEEKAEKISPDLVAQYEEKHGKKPHHRMSEESIRAAIAQ